MRVTFYAEAFVVGDGCLEKGYGAARLLVGLDLAEGDTGCIVDADMDELPARPAALGTAPGALACAIAGDVMTNPLEAAEVLDVDVDQLAGMGTLTAAYRRRRGTRCLQRSALGCMREMPPRHRRASMSAASESKVEASAWLAKRVNTYVT